MKQLTRKSKRLALAGAIAGIGLLATTAFAMAGPDADGGCRHGEGKHAMQHKAGGDFAERRAERLDALKTQLKLAPKQEAAWTAFVDAGKPAMTPEQRQARRESMRESMKGLTTPERMEKMQAMAGERQAQMRKRTQAVKVFYAQLDPQQRQTFDDAMAKMLQHDRHGPRHD